MNLETKQVENLAVVSLQNDKLRMQVQMGNHIIYADEPIENGGEAMGADPYELLSASLATCTLATLQLYLKRKKWNVVLKSIEVSFTDEDNAGIKTAHFIKTIKIIGSIDETQMTRLLLISDACPVSKILKSGNNKIDSFITL